jgi:hypothetical protein
MFPGRDMAWQIPILAEPGNYRQRQHMRVLNIGGVDPYV